MSDVTTGSVFNPQFFMNPPWWIGRVEEKKTWSDNIEGETFTSVAGIEGWSHRYKVRIFNWHTGELDKLPPKDMAFCQVVMPVTAGSGHGSASITPSIESGSVVFGFFMDGMAGQEGYIIGTIGNSNNNVPQKRGGTASNQSVTTPTGTSNPPVPATGPGSLVNVPVPPNVDQLSITQLTKLLNPAITPSTEVLKASAEAKQKYETEQKAKGLPVDPQERERQGLIATVIASRQPSAAAGTGANCNLGYQQFGDTHTDGDEMRSAKVPDDRILGSVPNFITEAMHIRNKATDMQDKDMNIQIPLLDVCKDGKSNDKGIQLVIQNLVNKIEFLKKLYNQASAFATSVTDFASQIQTLVSGAIQELAGYLKNILTGVRGFILTKFNEQISKIAQNLFPSQIPSLYTKAEQGLNLINCLFNRLIGGLKTLLSNLLGNILDQLINAPLCAVTNFLTDFASTILGPITSVLDSILSPINALFSVLDSFSGAFDFITGILKFFSCDESPDCIPYNQVSQAGPALPTLNLTLGLGGGGSGGGSSSDCSTGPVVCGSPSLSIFGSTIEGSIQPLINPIISPISSSVIGFDIINAGSGFLSTPTAALIDPCGNGSGASLQVNLENDGGTVNNIGIIENSVGVFAPSGGGAGTGGTGGTGGGAGVGLEKCDVPKSAFQKTITQELQSTKRIKNITIVSPGDGYLASPNGSLGGGGRVWKEPDEGYVKTKCGGYYVVQPYKPIKVEVGDTYYPPDGPPLLIEEDQIINLPLVPITPPKPENLGNTYPVILCIEEIKILDGGFGYRPGDELIITPNNGTKTELIINESGNIISIKVLEGGCGFLDFPEIKTNSATGFNATFSPIFKATRLEEFNQNNIDNLRKGNIPYISVVDCVGQAIP